MSLLTEQEIFECLPDNGDSFAFARAIEAKARAKMIAEINEQARLLGISAEKELALRTENERLKAELAEAKKDAERYRWLRDKSGNCDVGTVPTVRPLPSQCNDYWALCEEILDTSIDAAMKGK